MAVGVRATGRVALLATSALLMCGSATLAKPPEWQRDLDYLTWDRRAEGVTPATDVPVYLQPEGERTSAVSTVAAAPTWQLRVRDFYSLVTPRGWRGMLSKRDAAKAATATLTVPAPGQSVEQPVGAMARRHESPVHGTIVR